MPESRGVTVFEAVNSRRGEILIGATSLSMHALISRLIAAPPDAIRHWQAGEPVDYRSLEFGMTAADARAFIGNYRSTQDGWRVITAERID